MQGAGGAGGANDAGGAGGEEAGTEGEDKGHRVETMGLELGLCHPRAPLGLC